MGLEIPYISTFEMNSRRARGPRGGANAAGANGEGAARLPSSAQFDGGLLGAFDRLQLLEKEAAATKRNPEVPMGGRKTAISQPPAAPCSTSASPFTFGVNAHLHADGSLEARALQFRYECCSSLFLSDQARTR
jgi:hypothetical protein